MTTETHTKVVPSISSGSAGPLGVVHLPRLWLKLTLAAAGMLPEGYDECGHGFDAMTLAALGLDRDKTMAFIRQSKPSYMEFEEWIVKNGNMDKAAIEKHNAAVRGYNHSDDHGREMRHASGIKDAAIRDAIMLNMVEDLDEIHHQVTGR